MNLDEGLKKRIEADVNGNRVMIFMKGSPEAPRCGFSADVIDVFDQIGCMYSFSDVLLDWDLREGIKVFSNWPTIPQVYVDGKFIGGCDIVREMFEAGELQELLGSEGSAGELKDPDQPTEHLGECQKRCL